MKKIIVFILGFCAVFTSCSNISEEEIEENLSNGVVLVQNQSYYEVVLSDGESLFFSNFDEEGDLVGIATSADSVEVVTGYGTGFLISDAGEIDTNAHVVSNIVSQKDVNKSVASVISKLKKLVELEYAEYREKLAVAQQAYDYANRSANVSYADFYKVRDYRDNIQEQMNDYAEFYYALDEIRPSDSELKYHNEVSIAYNNTHVTRTTDFISCVVTKVDTEHDLAVIQLKDKKTPEGKYIFEIPEEDPLESYSVGDKLTSAFSDDKNDEVYMASFNLGPSLALTKEGVKSQFNHGSISQETSDRVMYSIPTLPGSSGSPVVNMKGELVAVNNAGITATQGFNYGVRVKYLQRIVEE